MACSASAVILPSSNAMRASLTISGRSKLPTTSARIFASACSVGVGSSGSPVMSFPPLFERLRETEMSSNLANLAYFAGQCGATRPKALAYVIDVNFEVEKQIGMPHRHAQIVGCLIDALQFGLQFIELRGSKVCLQTCLDSPEPLVQSAHAIASDPAAQLGCNI